MKKVGWMDGWVGVKAILKTAYCKGYEQGYEKSRVDGWMDRWVGVKAILRIAY